MLAAMSLIYEGGAFRLFGPTVFNFLSGLNPADLIAGISEVPDSSIREILKQVSLATNDRLCACVIKSALCVAYFANVHIQLKFFT